MDKKLKRKIGKFLRSTPIISNYYRLYSFRKIDVIINSFPKSGRTWLRVMLIRYLQLHYNLEINPQILNPLVLVNKNHDLPKIIFIHGNEDPFLLEPEKITSSTIGIRKKKFIFLVRDPKDVIISSYFQRTKRVDDFSNYKGTISEFLRRKKGGIETLLQFLRIWYENKSKFDNFLLIKYEDLRSNPEKEMFRILDFADLHNIDKNKIHDCVEFGSFKKMKKMEKNGFFDNPSLKPRNFADENSFKTRRGKVGGYVDYLSKNDIEFLNERIRAKLPPELGY